MKYFSISFLLCFLFISCKTVKSLRELNREEAKIYSYTFEGKEIKFCSMHHLGKKEFYSDVTQKIKAYKNEGYIVFYELISTNFVADSLEKDIIRRKARKIKGFSGSYKEMAENNSMLEKYIQQPGYKDLGIDSNDVRADVDYKTLISEYESRFGSITLDSIDLNTPFTENYNRKEIMNKSQYRYVIIEYRNNNLIQLLHNSTHKKILILYGEGHRQDLESRLN